MERPKLKYTSKLLSQPLGSCIQGNVSCLKLEYVLKSEDGYWLLFQWTFKMFEGQSWNTFQSSEGS